MLKRNILVFDFESGGRNPNTCQPTQLAAIGLDGRTLKPMGSFVSDIWAETDDEKATAAGLHPIEQEALDVTGATRERIAAAPKLKTVWPKFRQFVDKLNYKGTAFFNPIPAGHNIINYDMKIMNRICKELGPWDDKRDEQALYSPVYKIDLMDILYMWMENDPDVKSVSMAATLEKLKLSDEGAHDALVDVENTVKILTRFMETHREVYRKLRF